MSPATLRESLSAMNVQLPSRSLEFELMCLCARITVDSVAEARIRALVRQEVDWNFLIVTAHQHRVLPLLYRSLERVAPDEVPELAIRRLRSAFHANATRNLFLTGELLQVIDIFRAHDIPCIPYKGPVLASLVYGDISLRQFADLDVIVPVKAVARARALLVARGYRPEKRMSEKELLDPIRTEKDITLFRDNGIELEMHWGVTTDAHPIQISPQLLWKELGTHSIAGKSVQTLPYEVLLLIQCIHGATHGWERLGWLCDVAGIVRSQRGLNWDRAIEHATVLRGRRILFHGLALARDLLGAEPPANVLQAIQEDPVLIPLSEQVKGWLLSESPVPPGEREQFFMRLREHPADKLRVAFKQAKSYLALTSRDTESFRVPAFLTWMLYVLRPIRLACEYGLTPFTRFFKGIFQS